MADWTSHVFFFGRTPCILVTNTAALYFTVLYAKGITSNGAFISRALAALREFMEADGLAFSYDRFIHPRTNVIWFASSLIRSVTGSMNELIACAKVLLAAEAEVERRLELRQSADDLLLVERAREWLLEGRGDSDGEQELDAGKFVWTA